jgi:excisionase family DNA binding protein
MMQGRNEVLTTEEACKYLRISRPTFLKLVHSDQIRARKVGKGWKVLKSELQAYLRIDEESDFEMVMIP